MTPCRMWCGNSRSSFAMPRPRSLILSMEITSAGRGAQLPSKRQAPDRKGHATTYGQIRGRRASLLFGVRYVISEEGRGAPSNVASGNHGAGANCLAGRSDRAWRLPSPSGIFWRRGSAVAATLPVRIPAQEQPGPRTRATVRPRDRPPHEAADRRYKPFRADDSGRNYFVSIGGGSDGILRRHSVPRIGPADRA